MVTQRCIHFTLVPDSAIINNEPTEIAKKNWLKYSDATNRNTHYISYLMKKQFAGSQEIKYNEHKKPIIDDGFFNISHDKNLCVGIFDDKHKIGIDVMHIDRRFRNIDIHKKIFNDNEPKDVLQFCRKEAYIKMIGFRAFHENLLDVNINNGKIYYKGNLEPYDIFETMFNNYFICIVGKFNPVEFVFKEFEFSKFNV